VDRERVLAKLDALHGYERELGVVLPGSLNDYKASLEKRRPPSASCRSPLSAYWTSVDFSLRDCVSVCRQRRKISSIGWNRHCIFPNLVRTLRAMRRFRNILVHEYGAVDDEIVFRLACRLSLDVKLFTTEVTRALSAPRV